MQTFAKNSQFTLEIDDMTTEGMGVGRKEGFVFFVKGALPGDKVLASVTKLKKNYCYARIIDIISPSPDRIEPICEKSGQCGGCGLLSMKYSSQLKFKERIVKGLINRIGGIDASLVDKAFEGIIGMDKPFRYRNKAQYPIALDRSGRVVSGFYAKRSHRIVPSEDCYLEVAENRMILRHIIKWMEDYQIPPYDENTGSGLIRHVLIRKGFSSGEHMVCLVVNGRTLPHLTELISSLCFEISSLFSEDISFPPFSVDSLCISVQTEKTNVIMGQEIIPVYGPLFIEDKIGDLVFRISPLSFYQVNPIQTLKIYETVMEFSELRGDEAVWDLYSGIGTISLFLARKAKEVYGIEIVPDAVKDARENARRNGIDNAFFILGDAEKILPDTGRDVNVVCMDPPRKGMDEKILLAVAASRPEKIVYISCEPSTLSRDIKILNNQGYSLDKFRIIDNFPQTCHVETVVLLSQQKASGKIRVEINLEDMEPTSAESKATYEEIKEYILNRYGVKVSTLYISQIKRKCGLEMRKCYNPSKSENAAVPDCPPDKEEMILDALRNFKMI